MTRHPMASASRRKPPRHHPQHHHNHNHHRHGDHHSVRNGHETAPTHPSSRQHHLGAKGCVRDVQEALVDGKEEFVRGWLEQVASSRDGDGHTISSEGCERPDHRGVSPFLHEDAVGDGSGFVLREPIYQPSAKEAQHRHSEEGQHRMSQSRTRRRQISLSPKSFILPFNSPKVSAMVDDNSQASLEPEGCYYERAKHTRSRSHVSSTSRAKSGSESRRYEKRPRYKTREDKYDTLKSGEASRSRNTKDTRAKRKKNKKAMTSAREVVNNFTSHSILNDRLTAKSSLKPGLYQNGRASSTKPLTDLTFHKMKFLQQPRQITSEVVSKSHLRDKRREEEEMQDISAFFSHRKPLDMPNYDRRKHTCATSLSSAVTSDYPKGTGESHTVNQDPRQTQLRGKTLSHRRLSNAGNAISSALEQQDHLKGKSNTPHLSGSSYPSVRLSTNSRQPSPGHQKGVDPGPEAVRRAITETGIFNNTGIVFDPGASDGVEHLPSLSPSKPYTSKDPRPSKNEYLKSPVVRYRDQGTMVLDQPVDQPGVQHADGVFKPNNYAPFSVTHQACQTTNQTKSERSRKTSSTPRATQKKLSPVSHQERQNVVGDTTPSSPDQLFHSPVRPEAPKSLLVSQLEAMATMPPPPRPPVGHIQGVQIGDNPSNGATTAPSEKPLSCDDSNVYYIYPAGTMGIFPPLATQTTQGRSASTDQSIKYSAQQQHGMSGPLVPTTWLAPAAIRNSTPYSRVANSPIMPLVFDSQVQRNSFGPQLSLAHGFAPRHEGQPSIHEYITEIEREAIEQPLTEYQDELEDELEDGSIVKDTLGTTTPMESYHHNLVEGQNRVRTSSVLGACEPTASFRPGLATERLQTPSSLGHGQFESDWRHPTLLVQEMNDEDEVACMTQFWRPNQYSI